jgi:hypothetical protein
VTAGVNFNERIFIAGPTESGKSELVNVTFSMFNCQRLLYDTKGHEWSIADVEPVSDPAAIDWSQPIIHYVTASTEIAEAEEVFGQAEKRVDLVVAVHELGDLCEYHTNKTPASVNRYLAQGGANGRGFLGASQEPVDMPKRAKKEINHAFTMTPGMSPEHLQEIAKIVGGTTGVEMAAELEALHRESGDHSFIHWPRGALQEPVAYPPLPASMRSQSIVKRRRPHARERSR